MVNENLTPDDLRPDNEQEDVEKEENIDNTDKFYEAIEGGDFDTAEKILNKETFEEKERKRLQKMLFQVYYKEEDWDGVIRISNALKIYSAKKEE